MEEREESQSDKTEEASEERRKQFREEGNVASPRELIGALALVLITLMLSASGKALVVDIKTMFQRAWALFRPVTLQDQQLVEHVKFVFEPVAPWLGGVGVIMVCGPVLTGLLMTRFNWTWKKLEFNFDKLNPFTGMQRMFGLGTLLEALKTVAKGVVVGVVVYFVLKREIKDSMILIWSDLPVLSTAFASAVMRLFLYAAGASFAYGVIDFGINWFRMERKMMMTKQELKEEIKGQEGDPHVKSARRRMARDLVLRRNLSQVPNATFVVTNPQHFSVAIRYVKGMSAPLVIAKGQDFLALRIREIAKKHDIMIVENKPLARTLYKTVKVGQEVPASLYASVIEVMKYIYRARGRDYFDRFGVQPFGQAQPAQNQAG